MDLTPERAPALPPELLALCLELTADSLLFPPSPASSSASSSLADGGAATLTRRALSPPTALLKPDSHASSSELSVVMCLTIAEEVGREIRWPF